jgi:hypothetical protein
MGLYRLPGILALVAAGLGLSSCLTHEARVTAPPAVGSTTSGEVDGNTIIGAQSFPTPPGPPPSTVQSGPLPQEVLVTAWQRDAEGLISRDQADVRTELPWWQRFPCDMATDLTPTALVVRTEYRLDLKPITARTRAELDREALSAGYTSVSSGQSASQQSASQQSASQQSTSQQSTSQQSTSP